ncbi:MAG TPA: alpha/beta family hydrolase [Longimicrobiales bacterium]|nr:alpha/beta family hydrolase [Longimicrobiales bacterium]
MKELSPTELRIPSAHGDVHALLLRPQAADWLYVLAHGAGAGMRHTFMDDIAGRLAARNIATLRYEYPYMTAGLKRPDRAPKNEAVTRAACDFAAHEFAAGERPLRLCAGGKSMGGRMTSQAQAAGALPRVEALVFLGFPLHRPGSVSAERAAHLHDVAVPMLFLQGTRDKLADLALMRSVTAELGTGATLHVVDGADHSFHVLKRSGRSEGEALDEMADAIATWLSAVPS